MINLKNSDQATAAYSLIVATLFTFLCFYDTDPRIYLFPRIIAIALLIFSIILCISSLRASSESNTTGNSRFIEILPGLVVGFIYMAVMDYVGFYASSFFVFLAFLLLYGKRDFLDPKALVKKVIVSAVFVFVLYLLFWQGLHVRTPTGWIF
ncbi:MAG: O-antigen/teichoic acid export membrane protein [Gammaproteobacteria bacterium]|jgi:O-antigen/teichoic acid export membrane protein